MALSCAFEPSNNYAPFLSEFGSIERNYSASAVSNKPGPRYVYRREPNLAQTEAIVVTPSAVLQAYVLTSQFDIGLMASYEESKVDAEPLPSEKAIGVARSFVQHFASEVAANNPAQLLNDVQVLGAVRPDGGIEIIVEDAADSACLAAVRQEEILIALRPRQWVETRMMRLAG